MTPREFVKKIEAVVEAEGWAVQGVLSDPPYCYTVGLHKRGLPEVVVLGLPPEISQEVLGVVVRQLTEKQLEPREGAVYNEIFDGFPATFTKVSQAHIKERLQIANIIAQDYVSAWQLLWPDESGRFPSDDEASLAFKESQSFDAID